VCPRRLQANSLHASVQPRPPLFRALGRDEPPLQVEIGGVRYQRIKVFKHDSWAATALYAGAAGRVVCKFNRQQALGPLPLRWLGRVLAQREAEFLRRLAGLSGVPRWSGEVCLAGKKLEHAVAHEYIPGHPLGQQERVSPSFFPALQQALAAIHRRDVAYVDLHKRENILVGDDGLPYLVDFQIGFGLPRRWPGQSRPMRALLKLLQQSDEYHLRKHVARCASAAGEVLEETVVPPPWWIRAHRLIAVPFRSFRRWLLVRLAIRKGCGRSETEVFPEEAVRIESGNRAA
jgi:predicted Ser/Thr protein kinase